MNRGEHYASESDLEMWIQQLRDTYQIDTSGDSFTVLQSVAKKFATGKTPYELILVCKSHEGLKPMHEIAKRVLPKYRKQGEVIAPYGSRFRAVAEPHRNNRCDG